MRKLGLKVWSTNIEYLEDAEKIFYKGICDFIEIYIVPNSFLSNGEKWKKIKAPYVIHAPHYKDGVNLAQREKKHFNMKVADESKKFADLLGSDKIIFHPGAHGNIDEIVKQLKEINDTRVLIENKPYFGIGETIIFHGASVDDIKNIMSNSGVGFCLDFGHAVCAANMYKIDPMLFLNQMIELVPDMYHLTDGNYTGVIDQHDNYGSGTFPLREMINMIPDKSCITNEAKKKYKNSLKDFIEDEFIFRKFEGNKT